MPAALVGPSAVAPTEVVAQAPTTPPTPTAAPDPFTIFLDPALPAEVAAGAQQLLRQDGRFILTDRDRADLRLEVGRGEPLTYWTYVIAAPFASTEESVSLADVTAAWRTGERPLLASPETRSAWVPSWGTPALAAVPAPDLVTTLWRTPNAWAILPFHRLQPELKALAVDGHQPLAPSLANDYPLHLVVGLTPMGVRGAAAEAAWRAGWPGPTTNRDETRLTRVALTGVTALVRATAYNMELNGILWPGEEVGPVLRAADIAHLSNEVAFAADCPYPNPVGGSVFCSRVSYLELITSLGIDVVELTGNHLRDWGDDDLLATLALYEAAGLATYGGGRSTAEGGPIVMEHNGNRIAFMGCNPAGPVYAWATATRPGSLPCDDATLESDIKRLRAAGHLVIVTLQYWEHYDYRPTAEQRRDFRQLAAAGATAVSGSQGHHAQGFGFFNGAFLHYGLGNLFFDQMDLLGTRQTFVDTYVIYDGRLLNVELWTGLIENFARPRLMQPDERRQLLETTFAASDWRLAP